MTSSPLWASAFRPFYFLGASYAPLLVAAWLGALLGFWPLPNDAVPLKLQHGHEFIFGFAAAIITGIVLTALPSWAGTEEICDGRLMLLVALWLAGRVAFWTSAWLPAPLPAVADGLLYAALLGMLTPQLLRVGNRLYLLLLPILLALFAANLLYYHAATSGNHPLAAQALRLAIYAIVVLYVLKGGVLAPIFTGNVLREKGRGEQAPFIMGLEAAGLAALLLLAAGDLAGAAPAWTGSTALACALLYGWRSLRWQGWRVAEVPLLLVMHLGFAWLVFAFALKAAADLTGIVAEATWLHAFTVGSLGLMMLGLMTRVSLRHTGRPLVVPRALLLAYALMFVAALLRLAAGVHDLGNAVIGASALLWAASFALYLMVFARSLVTPSLPRSQT
ncbi:MAG: NnrS family protein [Betaproteobacteria bacterium]|nr:NnrS family protein [Betaproteobacteria bacterium]